MPVKPASPGAPYTVPPEPSRTPAILLAVAVHVLLLAFLYFGISWQSKTPISVEAEVWDMKVETAAAPPLPAPVVEPEPKPEPEPEPTPPAPTPPPPVPKVVEPEPVKPAAPDIALQREKERKLEQAKKEREREIAEKKEREEQKRKELAEEKRREEAKEREEQKKRELAEQKKKEEEKKKEDEKKLAAEKAEKAEADKKKKLAAEKAAKAKADAAAQAQLDKLRDLELKRIAGAAGSTGNAQKSSAPKLDSGYQAAIAAKVKSNTVYNGDEPGNPTVEFRIEQLPTGEILSVRKTKSSGVPAFDEAVERGIIKSSPLPKKKDGTVERTFPLVFKLKDLQ
ncbi:MAG TPA: cell envelope integrity protein TolA [Massilia sp.]|nr:cell envelope integrity protein TolA [Massilia sp.]